MVLLQTALPYIQIGLSVLLVAAILLQRTGASMGGAFGADNFSSGFHTRRGLERTLFHVTIALGILFALSALINLIISKALLRIVRPVFKKIAADTYAGAQTLYARQDNFESPCMNIHQRMTGNVDLGVLQNIRRLVCAGNYSKLY